jgi:hypothetical protein
LNLLPVLIIPLIRLAGIVEYDRLLDDMTSSTSPDPNTFYLIQPSGQTSNCIVSLPEGVPTTDYPLQVQPCNVAGDYAQWQIISDNAGAYFFYNRGFTGQSHRLDFVQPLGFPDILIMGPSNDTYHNQHWILNVCGPAIEHFIFSSNVPC